MATYTFWKLLNEFAIEIPLIQRDYAQGREGAKATQIREKFVTDLVTTLFKSESKDLDFVYGSTTTGKFVPLDGQQRLSTLFLLHWYLASASNNLETVTDNDSETIRNILTRFSYETRISSRDFCRALVTQPIAESDNEVLSEKIKECPWFFRSWAKDPTIKSMLVMLDAIEKHCKTHDSAQLWTNLIAENSVTFQFLNLADFQLTDELYIKMNARGKALTDFENFKAWFGKLVEENSDKEKADRWNISAEDWQKNMDKSWTDLFWRHKGPENHLIDEEFMQFFNGMALNHYVNYANTPNEDFIRKLINANYFTISDYEKCGILSEQFVNEASIILNQFAKYDSQIEDLCKQNLFHFDQAKSIFQKFINQENKRVTYPDRVRFFALTQFLLKNENLDIAAFKAWGRVVRNITENTVIDSAETFKGAITLIFELADKCASIYTFLSNSKSEIKSGFAGDQLKEEKIKASCISEAERLDDIINALEIHPLLKGNLEAFINNDSIPSDKLYSYYNAFSEIWHSDADDSLIIRALLAFKNYSIHTGWSGLGQRRLFGRDSSWKSILTKRKESKIKEIMPEFLDKYLACPGSKEEKLTSIINGWLKNSAGEKGWKYYFIKYPQMTSGPLNIFCWNNDPFEMRRLNGGNLQSYHLNPFAYTLAKFCGLTDNNCDMSYARNTDAAPLTFRKNNIVLYSFKEGWLVRLPKPFENEIGFNEVKEEFGLEWSENENGFIYKVGDEDRIEFTKALAIKLASLSSVLANAQKIEETALA